MSAALSRHSGEGPLVTTSFGRDLTVTPRRFGGSRAGKGKVVLKRGSIDVWSRTYVQLDDPTEEV